MESLFFSIVYHKNKFVSKQMEEFIDLVKKNISMQKSSIAYCSDIGKSYDCLRRLLFISI